MDKKIMFAGIGLLFCGFFMGHIIAGIIFFGILTAASIIILIETGLRSFKLWCGKYGFIIDLVLFIFSIMAIISVGVTVAGGLAVASLIFTLYRKFILVPFYDKNKPQREPRSLGSYISQGWCWCMDGVIRLFGGRKTVTD